MTFYFICEKRLQLKQPKLTPTFVEGNGLGHRMRADINGLSMCMPFDVPRPWDWEDQIGH